MTAAPRPPRARGHGFVVMALIASIGMTALLATMPMITTVTETAHVEAPVGGTDRDDEAAAPEPERTREVRHLTLAEGQGWRAVAAIATPLLFVPALALLVSRGTPALVVRMVGTLLLLAGVVLGIFSIGVFYAPTAGLMLVAAIFAAAGRATA